MINDKISGIEPKTKLKNTAELISMLHSLKLRVLTSTENRKVGDRL
jgi:hypothetical protein